MVRTGRVRSNREPISVPRYLATHARPRRDVSYAPARIYRDNANSNDHHRCTRTRARALARYISSLACQYRGPLGIASYRSVCVYPAERCCCVLPNAWWMRCPCSFCCSVRRGKNQSRSAHAALTSSRMGYITVVNTTLSLCGYSVSQMDDGRTMLRKHVACV